MQAIEVHLLSIRTWDHRHVRIKRANPLEALRFILCYKSILSNQGINPLKPELNPMCCLLTLLGAHHFLHVSRIRVK